MDNHVALIKYEGSEYHVHFSEKNLSVFMAMTDSQITRTIMIWPIHNSRANELLLYATASEYIPGYSHKFKSLIVETIQNAITAHEELILGQITNQNFLMECEKEAIQLQH